LESRILASLDQEEELVQLVPEEFKELPVVLKKLFQVIAVYCGV
jgi:hypothetical protein